MTSIRILGVSLLLAGIAMIAGCDFHEEPPPLEGDYGSRRFVAAFPDTTINIQAAGGVMEMSFNKNGDTRTVSGNLLVPEGTIGPNQTRIDTTFSGSYFKIVDRVTLDVEQRLSMLPTVWTYDDGVLTSQGFLDIELTKK